MRDNLKKIHKVDVWCVARLPLTINNYSPHVRTHVLTQSLIKELTLRLRGHVGSSQDPLNSSWFLSSSSSCTHLPSSSSLIALLTKIRSFYPLIPNWVRLELDWKPSTLIFIYGDPIDDHIFLSHLINL